MPTDKIKKHILPNIPYLFIGWAFLKLGTAYRLAAGANAGEKLLGLMQTIGVAFADFSPGLAPFDWLVGIVGAVAFRLLIYFKSKNAKKYRRDEEYGSARWGTEKDIKPFVDPKFENNIILTGTEKLTINTRPKNPANARNLNACVIGSSGSGKTRFWLTPQLLQAHSSYVVVDPKGGVLSQVGSFLQKRGYKIKVFKSNNGIERSKYITFGLPAGSVAEARPRLGRVESDVMGNLKRLGVQSQPLDGRERLALLHGQLHPGSREPFRFAWKDISKIGMGTKDYIAPDSFDFRDSRTFRVGRYYGAASYLQILASELSDRLLAEILELDAELTVTLHIQTVDQLKAIKTIKGKISDIGRMKAEEQKKAVRAGYDMEILPPDLITFSKDAAELLADLQSRNERMFLLTFTVVNLAPTRQRLENDVFTVGGIAQKYNCALKRLDWQQEQGFVSSLALGYNGIEIQRGMTTSSTAIFIPFMTRELRMDGQALYYGMNALSHNVIMADRKKLKSAKQLGISEHQLSYITHSNSGEGLLFYGNVTIPFVDRFPRGEIYDLLTTRPEDMAHERTDQ